MRKLLLSASVCALISGITSCSHFGGEKFELATYAAADSVSTPDDGIARAAISIESPIHNSVVADSVNAWILQSVNAICSSVGINLPAADKVDQTLADNFVKTVMTDFRSQLSDPEWAPIGLDMSVAFTCDTVTDRFASFLNATYTYMGGAHGSMLYYGRTINLKDASWITWDMIPRDKDEAFLKLVLENLASQYFESSEAEAVGQLFLPDSDTLPYPVADPLFSADGLQVIYQQYEIGPYAIGSPSCVIPYDRLRDFIRPELADLIPAGEEE